MTRSVPAIDVRGLRKSFGPTTVLDGVDLRVDTGSVFALLGANGAGKSTTVRILTTLLRPDGGTVTVAGLSLPGRAHAVRENIALTGQYAAIDDVLTGTENLRLAARIAHLPSAAIPGRVRDLIERFDFAHVADRRAGTYSGGTMRRLDIAMSLVASPQVLFLDEPTTGLDPRSRLVMWEAIRELADDGVTIFLTTQYLEEADRLADRIAVLDGGRIVAEGTPDVLKSLVRGGYLELRFSTDADLTHAASVLDGEIDRAALTLQVHTKGDLPHVAALLDRLAAEAVPVEKFGLHSPTLDDVFLTLTGSTDETKVVR
ncbi:ATP-binding cassette domain-containing protein [Rhodococcus pyridinivorans]